MNSNKSYKKGQYYKIRMKKVWMFQGVLFARASQISQYINWKWDKKHLRKKRSGRFFDIDESNLVYQINNACYNSYTIESVQKSDESDNQIVQCGDESGKKVQPCPRDFFVCKEKGHPERINMLKQWLP